MRDRVTHKSATIMVALGGRLRTFRSLDEVPPEVRERLVQSTSGPYSATLLIADEAGRREIMRSLQGQPSAVESRWIRSFSSRQDAEMPVPSTAGKRWRHIAELALLGGIGLCLWLLAAWR